MSFFGRFFMVLLLVVSVIETATLAGWLALTTVNAILAIVVLFVGLAAVFSPSRSAACRPASRVS